MRASGATITHPTFYELLRFTSIGFSILNFASYVPTPDDIPAIVFNLF